MTSTKKVSLAERRELWKFMHAQQTFEQVETILGRLRNEQISNGNPLFYPLLVALVVLYGRPFKQQGLRLPEDLIPEQFRMTHSALIEARDKIYAHTDLGGLKLFAGSSINQITILVKSKKAELFFSTVAMDSEALNRVSLLVSQLLEKTGYHMNKIWMRYAPSIHVPDGEYQLNLSENDDRLLVPLAKSHEISDDSSD